MLRENSLSLSLSRQGRAHPLTLSHETLRKQREAARQLDWLVNLQLAEARVPIKIMHARAQSKQRWCFFASSRARVCYANARRADKRRARGAAATRKAVQLAGVGEGRVDLAREEEGRK